MYEGERHFAKDNHHLGTFVLNNVPKGKPQLEVTMKVDYDNILTVTAAVKGTTNCEQITIETGKRAGNVDEMLKKAAQMKDADKRIANSMSAMNKLSQYLTRSEDQIKAYKVNASFLILKSVLL